MKSHANFVKEEDKNQIYKCKKRLRNSKITLSNLIPSHLNYLLRKCLHFYKNQIVKSKRFENVVRLIKFMQSHTSTLLDKEVRLQYFQRSPQGTHEQIRAKSSLIMSIA